MLPANPHDSSSIVESLYRLDLAPNAWLGLVAERLAPLLDRYGLGVIGAEYDCKDPCSFVPSRTVIRDVSPALCCVSDLNPAYVADGILSRSCFLGSLLRGWGDIPCVQTGRLRDRGAADQLSLNAVEPDGAGCWFGSFQRERAPLSDEAHIALTRVARHLAAAHRLRRRVAHADLSPATADAVLDPSGSLLEATGTGKTPASREALGRAVRAMDSARATAGRGQTPNALDDWTAMVEAGWTLVDHFERDGRRYVLAIEHRPYPPGFERLSERERQVVCQMLLGLHNKGIAYELGIAPSTVRVLVMRAAVKVGAHSRRELLDKARRALGPANGAS